MEEMTAEQAAEAAKGLTFEKVWVMFMESKKSMDESFARTEESFTRTEESFARSEKRTEESLARMEKTVSALSKNIGELGNTLGRFTEAMFETELWKKFAALGFTFERQSSDVKYRKYGQVIAQMDLFFENCDYAMPVEVKTELNNNDVDEHLERIEKVRHCLDERNDARKLVGAVAGGIVSESTLKYAQNKGLFVIVQNGDSIAIAARPEGFRAREW